MYCIICREEIEGTQATCDECYREYLDDGPFLDLREDLADLIEGVEETIIELR